MCRDITSHHNVRETRSNSVHLARPPWNIVLRSWEQGDMKEDGQISIGQQK